MLNKQERERDAEYLVRLMKNKNTEAQIQILASYIKDLQEFLTQKTSEVEQCSLWK